MIDKRILFVFVAFIATICADDSTESKSTDTKTLYVCEHKAAQLECTEGKVIKIISANYGRTANKICMDGTIDASKQNLNCTNEKTLEIVRNRCEMQRTCSIDANNQTFRDQCVGTQKYLQLEYACDKI